MEAKNKCKKIEKKKNNNNKYSPYHCNYVNIILNVSDLNTPIKKQRSSEWIKNQGLDICCL